MRAFRLVNKDHDPTDPGTLPVRASIHSHQKLGRGMYFCPDRESALQGSHRNNHEYTHLLECEIHGVEKNDLFDAAIDQHSFPKWKIQRQLQDPKAPSSYPDFCKESGHKGLIWQPANGSMELVIHEEYFDQFSVEIIKSEPLLADQEGGNP